MALVPCMWCKGHFLDEGGPTHEYMESTSGCWAAFGRVLALHYVLTPEKANDAMVAAARHKAGYCWLDPTSRHHPTVRAWARAA